MLNPLAARGQPARQVSHEYTLVSFTRAGGQRQLEMACEAIACGQSSDCIDDTLGLIDMHTLLVP